MQVILKWDEILLGSVTTESDADKEATPGIPTLQQLRQEDYDFYRTPSLKRKNRSKLLKVIGFLFSGPAFRRQKTSEKSLCYFRRGKCQENLPVTTRGTRET